MSITLKDVKYVYLPQTPFEKIAIKNINLEIRKGEFIAVIGHTGSGKSTLIQHLNGLLKPTEGAVYVDDIDISQNTPEARFARQKVGMVFQYPEHQLFEETIYDDIAFGPRNMELSEEDVEDRVKKAMNFVNLDYEIYKGRSPFQLSGGQMRRVAIAGVIALEPEYLVLDEPSAGLDPCGRDDIFKKIKALYRETKIGVILVSHNMDDVAKLADRIIVMNQGEVSMDALPLDIFEQTSKLHEAGLEVPQMTKLLCTLRGNGIAVNTHLLNIEDAVKDILATLRR